MQPYFFPYIGYFQMLCAVDIIIFLDDAQFVPRRWINRNRIILSSRLQWITLPVNKAPQKTAIKDVTYDIQSKERRKILRGFDLEFGGLPGYGPAKNLLLRAIEGEASVAENNIESILTTLATLGIPPRNIIRASQTGTEGLTGKDRIITLARLAGGTNYVNLPGGEQLYDGTSFESAGLALEFVAPTFPVYRQATGDFVPGLSILDVIGRAGVKAANGMLTPTNYSLRQASP